MPAMSIRLLVSILIRLVSTTSTCAIVTMTLGCSQGAAEKFGPAAVVPGGSGDDMEAGLEGTIAISDDCILLRTDGDHEVMLVFREDQIDWDSDSEELELEVSGDPVRLTDGLAVILGGGGSSMSEDGQSTEEYVDNIDWVHEPARGCWRDQRFEVHSAYLS